jgi:hypothetical protein
MTTQSAALREAKIKRRMKSINVTHRSYFIKSETNIRLCHIERGHYKYITIPFCDCEAMETAAIILKQCGIVDGYNVEKCGSNFYVALFQYRYRKHVDSRGMVLNVLESKTVEWSELYLTRDDVKQFVARSEMFNSDTPHRTPAIPMVTYNTKVVQLTQRQQAA